MLLALDQSLGPGQTMLPDLSLVTANPERVTETKTGQDGGLGGVDGSRFYSGSVAGSPGR